MKYFICVIASALFCISSSVHAHANYGKKFCSSAGYKCVTIKRGQSWESKFPNATQRNIVRKVNRINVPLKPGYVIAVPNNLSNLASHMDVAPMPRKIGPNGRPTVKVNLTTLSWGAYDVHGNLLNWGPISGGQNYCKDVNRGCRTITGDYTFYRKQGQHCKSSKYPRPNGGAPMPYCMHFKGGYAMHASATVPGHHASHGCVRMFLEDARWLNQNFVRTGKTKVEIRR